MTRTLTFLCFSLVLIISLLLPAGCSDDGSRYRIGVSQCSYDDWRLKLNDELRRQSVMYPEIELDITSAYDDPDRQVEDIRRMIADKVDVIMASPVNSDNLNGVLREARAKGIKVITFDRQPSADVSDIFVSADNPKLGRSAAEYLVAHVGPEVKIIEIRGLDNSSPSTGRHEGMLQALAEHPGAECVASADGQWNQARAEVLADSMLRAHPEAQAILAHNDRMAIGARQAARRLGRDVRIAGIDAVAEIGINAVAKGDIDATFIYPTGGAELIDLAVMAARGEELQEKVLISTAAPVDTSNADIMLDLNRSVVSEQERVEFLKDRVNLFRTRENEQRVAIVAIVMVVVLLAVVIFLILKAYWNRRRSQEQLARQNAQLITQRDELTDLNARLNEATSAKLTFFTNVSHDLRTPLTLIAAPLHQLRAASNLTAEQHAMVNLADKNVGILKRLINQILDFRKYENGRLRLHPVEADVRRCFTEWGESFRPLARQHHIRINLEIGELAGPTMAFDIEKLERIYFNLMSNAFKFTPPNGTVTSRVSMDGTCLRLEVIDTGVGMDAETAARVFERFYQADGTNVQGSGIGLAVAKAFTELHGGTVAVESEPGHGSRFIVEIPVSHVPEASASSASPASSDSPASSSPSEASPSAGQREAVAAGGSPVIPSEPESMDESKPSVLVIDDTADIRALVRMLLKADYNILEAPTGAQGIKIASKYIPDLIICDVMMPGLDGMETTRRLKQEVSTSHIPVMMLTACSLDEQRAQGYDSGADGYLSKPFNADVLLARCRSLIANRRLLFAAKEALDSPTSPVIPASTAEPASASSSSSEPRKTPSASSKATAPGRPKSGIGPAIESEFYQRFLRIVDEELGNPDITVEEIGSRLGLSRVQFYRKIKALTNYSPNEILRIRRLKTAHGLLTSTESTVSEIAYKVGFSSPSYFTKCFREYFGELPADLQKRTSKIV